MQRRLRAYADLIRLNRPIGVYLLLWPTLWALWIAADGVPPWRLLLIFSLGVFLMRSAGCAINDFADREIDPHVERTRARPLAAGVISAKEALGVFAALTLTACSLLIFLNELTRWMAVAAVLLAASYPFMKRFHSLPQVHLGIAYAWAIPMAFTAETGTLPGSSGWLLFMAAIIWTVAYDTMYAMTDREDDVKIGVKSTAILFGSTDRAIVALLQVATLVSLYLVGTQEHLGFYYNLGLGTGAVFFLYQQFLIQHRVPAECFRAFLNNHYFGMVVFIGLVADKWFTA